MITGISIDNFRGISRQSHIDGFKSLNILIGPNNVGKSAIMQAFPLASGMTDFLEWLGPQLGFFRGSVLRTALFSGSPTALTLRGNNNDGVSHQWHWSRHPGCLVTDEAGNEYHLSDNDASARWNRPGFWHRQPFAYCPSDPDVLGRPFRFEDTVSGIIASGRQRKLIGLMQTMLPSVVDVRILSTLGEPALYIEEANGQVWPAASLGDGIKRLLALATFLALDASLVFVEEPEAHHHPGSARHAARLVWEAVADNRQLFVTTHSVQFLDELLDSADGREDGLAVFHIKRDRGEVSATVLSASRANASSRRNQILQSLDPRWPG